MIVTPDDAIARQLLSQCNGMNPRHWHHMFSGFYSDCVIHNTRYDCNIHSALQAEYANEI